MDASALRPLGIGETLDAAITIYRTRFFTMAKAVGVVVAPVFALAAVVQVSVLPDSFFATDFQPNFDPESEVPVFDAGDFWATVAGYLVIGAVTFVAAQLATATALKIVSGTYLGEEPDWRDSLRFAFRRLGSLIWLSIVLGVLLLLGFLACVIPGIYFYGAWTVAVPVLLLEDIRGRRALKRSRTLVEGRWWPVVAAVVVATIVGSTISGALSALLVAVVATADNELLFATVQGVANVVSSIVTTPFTAAVVAVVYFDLRVRKEGFDLELLAREVGIEPPEGARPSVLPPPPPPARGGAEPPFWPPPPGWRPPDD